MDHWLHEFRRMALTRGQREYLEFHKKRYSLLLSAVDWCRNRIKRKNAHVRMLDIGPSFFTHILKKEFKDDEICSMGFYDEKNMPGHLPKGLRDGREMQRRSNSHNSHKNHRSHIEFDLNDSHDRKRWPHSFASGMFDIVVFAEVLEHLHTDPNNVFRFIRSHLRRGGYLLVQTPNAVSLKKRIGLLLGRNPYEMIRDDAQNPGHYREYTGNELKHLAVSVGFKIQKFGCGNYFCYASFKGKAYSAIQDVLPSGLRDGLMMTLKK